MGHSLGKITEADSNYEYYHKKDEPQPDQECSLHVTAHLAISATYARASFCLIRFRRNVSSRSLCSSTPRMNRISR